MFEPIHSSYPQAAGQNIANPITTILSAAMLLDHLGLINEAIDVRQAVKSSLINGMVTEDLSRQDGYGTDRVGDFIANSEVSEMSNSSYSDYLKFILKILNPQKYCLIHYVLDGTESCSQSNIKIGLNTII